MLEEITKNSINEYTRRSHRHIPCKSTFEVADHRAWPSLEFGAIGFQLKNTHSLHLVFHQKGFLKKCGKVHSPCFWNVYISHLTFMIHPFQEWIFVHLSIHSSLSGGRVTLHVYFFEKMEQAKHFYQARAPHHYTPAGAGADGVFLDSWGECHAGSRIVWECCLPLLATITIITIPKWWTIWN